MFNINTLNPGIKSVNITACIMPKVFSWEESGYELPS